MSDEPKTGHVYALAMKAALAPVLAKLDVHGEKLAQLEPVIGSLRERLAVSEARAPLPGPPGPPGNDGAPGIRAEELVIEQDADDDRLVTLGFKRNGTTTTLGSIRFSVPKYCGVFSASRQYQKGDQVTHAGALWHCNGETSAARPGESDVWTLQVKRGDGR